MIKELGVKDAKHWKDLPADMVNILVPSKIQAIVSGVSMIKQDNKGKITLVYSDNSEESATLPALNIAEADSDSYFSTISAVQQMNKLKVITEPSPTVHKKIVFHFGAKPNKELGSI